MSSVGWYLEKDLGQKLRVEKDILGKIAAIRFESDKD